VSGSPIVFEDEAALRDLTTIADYVLAHNRPIVMPQDDSVLRISPQTQQPIFVRRSRGYAPNFLGKTTAQLGNNLSFGASLKATFCVQSNKQLFVSQYLGEIESYDTQIQFGRVLAHLTAVLQTKENDFQRLFCDAHEGYASTQMAREFSEQHHIPLRKIQHHEAHLAAVLAENNAFAIPQKTLGVVWDGTGYGTDGQVWGGEFFVLPSNDFRQAQRLHFAYFDAIVADKMPREPRLSALSLCQNNTRADDLLRPLFSATAWTFYQKTLQKNTLKTSSMGRIFDGVAALLGLLDVATYEGQAAMLLETEALRFFEQNGYDFDQHYPVKFTVENNVCTHSLVANVVEDILAQRETGLIAAQFHLTLVRVVAYVARLYQVQAVAFSGGVFQNAVLTDLLRLRLGHSYKLYFHQQLPPNDECISFGQMVLGTGI
jgi:hydrogenase maturation protein HypF